jgi:hypothetical protein
VFERRGRLGVFDHDKIIVLSHEARDAEKFAAGAQYAAVDLRRFLFGSARGENVKRWGHTFGRN